MSNNKEFELKLNNFYLGTHNFIIPLDNETINKLTNLYYINYMEHGRIGGSPADFNFGLCLGANMLFNYADDNHNMHVIYNKSYKNISMVKDTNTQDMHIDNKELVDYCKKYLAPKYMISNDDFSIIIPTKLDYECFVDLCYKHHIIWISGTKVSYSDFEQLQEHNKKVPDGINNCGHVKANLSNYRWIIHLKDNKIKWDYINRSYVEETHIFKVNNM